MYPSAMKISNCTASTELCVSTVVSRLQSVYTVRGCAGEVPECSSNDPYCVRCNGSLCNSIPTVWGTHHANKQLKFAEGRMKHNWLILDILWPSIWYIGNHISTMKRIPYYGCNNWTTINWQQQPETFDHQCNIFTNLKLYPYEVDRFKLSVLSLKYLYLLQLLLNFD